MFAWATCDFWLEARYDFGGSNSKRLVEWVTIPMLQVLDDIPWALRTDGHVQEYES